MICDEIAKPPGDVVMALLPLVIAKRVQVGASTPTGHMLSTLQSLLAVLRDAEDQSHLRRIRQQLLAIEHQLAQRFGREIVRELAA